MRVQAQSCFFQRFACASYAALALLSSAIFISSEAVSAEPRSSVSCVGDEECLQTLARSVWQFDLQGDASSAADAAQAYLDAALSSATPDFYGLDAFLIDLARRLSTLGRIQELKDVGDRFVEAVRRVHGENSEATQNAQYRVAWLLTPLDALPVREELSGAERAKVIGANRTLSEFSPYSQQHAQALLELFGIQESLHVNARRRAETAHRLVAYLEVSLGDQAPAHIHALLLDLARLHEELQESPQSLALLRRYAMVSESLGLQNSNEAQAARLLMASVFVRLRRFDDAIEASDQLKTQVEAAGGDPQRLSVRADAVRAQALAGLGRVDDARALAQRALDAVRADTEFPKSELNELEIAVARVIAASDRHGDAGKILKHQADSGALVGSNSETGLAVQRHNQAIVLWNAGKLAQALEMAKSGLDLFEAEFDAQDPILAEPLSTVGGIFLALNQPEKAHPYVERSVALVKGVFGPDHSNTAKKLINLALVQNKLGRGQEAIETMKRVGRILEGRTPQDPILLATYYHEYSIIELGEATKLYASLTPKERDDGWVRLTLNGMTRNAKNNAISAQAIRRSELPEGHTDRAKSDGWVATIQMSLGESVPEDTANALITVLLSTPSTPANAEFRAGVEASIALAYLAQNKKSVAVLWAKEAVNTSHDATVLQAGHDVSAREALAQKGRYSHQLLVALLVSQGRLTEAQQVIQLLKEFELRETLRGATQEVSARAQLTGLERSHFREYYRMRDEQAALAVERADLERLPDPTPEAKDRLAQITELQTKQREAMVWLLKGLEAKMAEAPVGQNNQSVLVETTQLARAVSSLAVSEPDAKAVGLQYIVSDDVLSILITPPDSPPIAHQVNISRPKLYQMLNTALVQIGSPDANSAYFEPSLKALYAQLIEPIASDLKRLGAGTLMLSLDDRLRQFPFAALMSKSGRFLVEDYTLAQYNEAAGQQLKRAGVRNWNVAAMGLSNAVAGKPALNAVPIELKGVVSAEGIQGQVFLNNDFSRERLLASLSGSNGAFNALHVASHFDFRPGEADESVLYLGDGETLTLAQLADPSFNFENFDLVTYSACESAKAGGRVSSGQELESLSAITQRHGAQAVMATLWKVADKSTSELMIRYYNNRRNMNKAQALRNAQLAMLRDEHRVPYQWAPFVLMGNWR